MKTGEYIKYRGKHFDVPVLTPGICFAPEDPLKGPFYGPLENLSSEEGTRPIFDDMATVWDLQKFKTPRKPYAINQGIPPDKGFCDKFTKEGAINVLDLPIKFPGSDFRIPKELLQFEDVIRRVAQFERQYNHASYDEYYCYVTVDQRNVKAGTLQREAPCHVDGFQGAKWNPKVKINHTYVISDKLPTTYYVQPFNFDALDEAKHNFFWEMNRQVALTNSQFAWQPQPFELNLIDAYTVHRGTPAETDCFRTWLRLSFEVRIFNRLGNAHNPMFDYQWEMEPRDIEGLNLVAFDPTSDPSLRVFPWQKEDGSAHEDRHTRTQPKLKKET